MTSTMQARRWHRLPLNKKEDNRLIDPTPDTEAQEEPGDNLRARLDRLEHERNRIGD